MSALNMLANPREAWHHFSTWWVRGQFRANDKIEFFKTLKLMLQGNVQLPVALTDIYNAYSEDGRKSRNIVAVVSADCLMQIRTGKSFGEALRRWLPDDECSLLDAGSASGNILEAFDKVMRIVRSKGLAVKAVMSATVYPTILMLQCAYLLNKVANDLVPKLLRGKAAETVEGPAWVLKELSFFVSNYGHIAAMSLVVLGVLVILSLPVLRGNVRYYLDKLPPYSFYRMMYGSTFLLNIGVQMSAGIKLSQILTDAARHANPWLRERLEATLFGVNNGKTLGQALTDAGYDFPDRRAVYFLRAITSQKGSEENIEQFGADWLDQSIVKLQALAKVMLASGIILNGAIILLVLAGASGMEDASLATFDK